MDSKLASQKGLQPWVRIVAWQWQAAIPMKWASPVFAVPKLLARHGLKMSDIGLWELNEALHRKSFTAATLWAFPTTS